MSPPSTGAGRVPARLDARKVFMPSELQPFADAAIAELCEVTLEVAEAVGPRVADACQQALDDRGYSDAPTNPRGKDVVQREMADMPAVDELGTALKEYMFTRWESRPEELSQWQRANAKIRSYSGEWCRCA